MSRVAALLAAALLAAGAAGCGGDGAEPGAPDGATLVLDFTPNAVHSGIYAAEARGLYRDAGVDLTIREPGESTDAPKLLEAGRADFAILDIHDLGIARERGLDLVGRDADRAAAAGLGDRPRATRRCAGPATSRAAPSASPACPPTKRWSTPRSAPTAATPPAVDRVTIGFNAIASLAAGRVDAATGFWNAEGVALRRRGVPIRVFKVDDYGAPPYPELVLVTTRGDARARSRPGRRGRRRDPPRLRARGPRPGPRARRPARLGARASTAPSRRPSCGPCFPTCGPPPSTRPSCAPGRTGTSRHGLLEKRLDVRASFQLPGEERSRQGLLRRLAQEPLGERRQLARPSASAARPGRRPPPRPPAGSPR